MKSSTGHRAYKDIPDDKLRKLRTQARHDATNYLLPGDRRRVAQNRVEEINREIELRQENSGKD